MKTFRVPLALLLIGVSLQAQDAVPPDFAAPVTTVTRRTPQELDQLLAPIALYPDALIALILPASTVPTDIVLAARHLRDNPGDRTQIEHRAWDESVKSLTNYPEVVTWMDDNLNWTRQLGEAFAEQPAEVMQAVQRLRAQARAAGTLVDTPQQQVIAEPQVIRIVPAQPHIIYVPHYQPEIVFVDRPIYYGRPFLTFGIGVPVGSWLAYDCDWRRHSIWVGNRHRRWTGHDWRRPVVPIAPTYNYTRNSEVRQWRPPPQSVRPSVTITQRFRPEIARPAPFGLATARSNSFRDSGPTTRRSDFSSPPVVPALPRNFSPGFRTENAGPRASTQFVAPPASTPQVNLPAAPAPNVQPLPQARRPGRDGSRDDNDNNRGGSRFDNNRGGSRDEGNQGGNRDDGNRGRSFRGSQPNTTISAPVVPPLPMATSPRSIQPVGPMPQRSFSRGTSVPDVAPALPMRNRSAPPAAVGPVAPPAAPVAAPQATTQTAPQQAAPAQRNGGESRGHRGGGRRDNS